jgi:hypothetical protein
MILSAEASSKINHQSHNQKSENAYQSSFKALILSSDVSMLFMFVFVGKTPFSAST